MSGEKLLCHDVVLCGEPALTNRVAKVSMPIAIPLSAAQGTKTAVEKGLTVFDAAKTSLNTVKAEKVYGVTAKATKAVKAAGEKVTFAQALKRFKFSGKAKFLGVIAAAGLVTASALGMDN